MCQENLTPQSPENKLEDIIPERFINDPRGYEIWLGFQEIMNMTQEERDELFKDDFV